MLKFSPASPEVYLFKFAGFQTLVMKVDQDKFMFCVYTNCGSLQGALQSTNTAGTHMLASGERIYKTTRDDRGNGQT